MLHMLHVLTGSLHPPICFDPACYARWHMSWVCALCNLCILLTRDLTPLPSHWLHGYRDMLGVINQPNAKQMWKLMCLYNLNELYFVTFLEKQILQIKYLGEICVTTIIFICVPLSMCSIILSTSTSTVEFISSLIFWYKNLYFEIFFIAHFSMHYQLQLHYRI